MFNPALDWGWAVSSDNDDPATAYIRGDGHYVVRNDVDGTIVQISNRPRAIWYQPF
jgi:hypothetical protein